MAYSETWDNSAPDGSVVLANTLDTEIQDLKKAITERMNDLVGAGNWENDAVDPKLIQQVAIDPSTFVWGTFQRFIGDFVVTGGYTNVTNWAVVNDPFGMLSADTFVIPVGADGVYEIHWNCQIYMEGSQFLTQWLRNGFPDSDMLITNSAGNTLPLSPTVPDGRVSHLHTCVVELAAGDVLTPQAADISVKALIAGVYTHITIKRLF